MKIQETKLIETEITVAKKCDRCGVVHRTDDMNFELDEMVSISKTGGYGSIFGDMSDISIDLCQRCFAEVLGDFIRVIPPEF